MAKPASLAGELPTAVPLAGDLVLSGLPPLYEEDVVARYLGVSERTLQRRRARKEIPFHEIGGKPKYTPTDVQWILDKSQCNPELLTSESSTASPTNTPSSGAPARPCSTSSGASNGKPERRSTGCRELEPAKQRARELILEHAHIVDAKPEDVPLVAMIDRYYLRHGKTLASRSTAKRGLALWGEYYGERLTPSPA
jgi:hypothetical protein